MTEQQRFYKLLNNIQMLYDVSAQNGVSFEGKSEYQIVLEILAVVKRTNKPKHTLKVVK